MALLRTVAVLGRLDVCLVAIRLVFHSRSFRRGNTNYNFYFGFVGQFPAELGLETPLNGSGSKNGAERTQNQPRRPILRPFRDHVLVRTHN